MSLVYITHHDENVADLDNTGNKIIAKFETHHKSKSKNVKNPKVKTTVKFGKPSMIISPSGTKLLTDGNISTHKTMGLPKEPLPPPCARRHIPTVRWRRITDHVCPKPPHMSLVPRLASLAKSQPPNKSNVNFVQRNIDHAKSMRVPQKEPKYAYTIVGDNRKVANSGLYPEFSCSSNFGKVPCYIQRERECLEKEKEASEIKEEKQTQAEGGVCSYKTTSGIRLLTVAERKELVDRLRANYKKLENQYHHMSLICDTETKRVHHAAVESKLNELEEDIALIEKNREIFVENFEMPKLPAALLEKK